MGRLGLKSRVVGTSSGGGKHLYGAEVLTDSGVGLRRGTSGTGAKGNLSTSDSKMRHIVGYVNCDELLKAFRLLES